MRSIFFQHRRLVVLGAIVTVAACGGLSDPAQQEYRYGSVIVDGDATTEGAVEATAKGLFFTTFQTAAVPSSITSQNDACTTTDIDTTTVETIGVLNAGEALTLQVGSNSIAMPWTPLTKTYDSPSEPFSYTPGATAQLTVPGSNTFPGGSVSVALVEPLVAPPVAISSTQRTITWNPSSSTTSAVLLSLRYADPATAGFGNKQIVCQLKDDGSITIPSDRLAPYLASPLAYRSLTLSRFRTSEAQLNPTTLLHINSQITIPVQLQ